MIVPATRWYVVAALLALLAPLSLVLPAAATVWFVANVLWVLALVLDAWAIGDIELPAFPVRREAPPAFSVGRPMPVRYYWRNPSRRRLTIRVRESVVPCLAPVSGPDRLVIVPRGDQAIETLHYSPLRRGKGSAGTLYLRVRGPAGLAWRQGRRDLPWNVTVYPSLRGAALRALPSEARRRREAGLRNLRRIGQGRLFESLKEWVPGDDTRSIDWKATARRGKVMVRQYEDERRQQVMIVLDAGRMLTAESDGRARLEAAIDAALDLAYSAVLHEDNLGLLVFADEVLHYVAPGRGRRALRQVLDTLAAVEGRMVESDYPSAFAWLATRSRKRGFTALFTDVIDRTASDAFLAQAGGLGPHHLPVAVTLRDPALERTATGRPPTVGAAFNRAAAEELLEARDIALAELRARGVRVLDVLPHQAAAQVVAQYQTLKRRGAI